MVNRSDSRDQAPIAYTSPAEYQALRQQKQDERLATRRRVLRWVIWLGDRGLQRRAACCRPWRCGP